jgi:hypothetical protein
VDIFHPTFGWLFAGAGLVTSVSVWMGLVMAQPDHEPTMTKSRVWGIAMLATVLLYAGTGFLAFVQWPTAEAQGAWFAQEEAALTPACVSAVLYPAHDTLANEGAPRFFGCVLAPVGMSALLYWVAFDGRGLSYWKR